MANNKMPIAWHEERLKNIRAYKESKNAEILRLQADIQKLTYQCLELEQQIALARKKGLSAFDHDRFGKKKGE